jgi:hypothetical protein
MSNFKERQALLLKLKSHRKRNLITLITSTKKPEHHFAAQIATDLLPVFYELFQEGTKERNVDLMLYSAGGMIDAPWPIVNLIREYYDDFQVIIPWRAHSAATLIALGANAINMGPIGSLSPIDPQLFIRHEEKKETVKAGIEDIYGYYLLIQDTLNLDSAGKTEALKLLASRISPEILGQASRIRNEIRIIATNLLGLHLEDDKKIESIVSSLVEKLHSHQYMINRREAQRIGLPVSFLDSESEVLSSQILASYVKETKMDEPGMAVNFSPGETKKVVQMNRAFVETPDRSFVFKTEYTFHKDGKVEARINTWMEEMK